MALRDIASFHRDEQGDWVAVLACGHPQHVRHRPPIELRPWVESEAGRAGMVGQPLRCNYCDMPTLPAGAEVYKTSKEFTESTVPDGLLRDHRTRAGTWGRIVVREGKLLYALAEPSGTAWMLRPGIDGIVAPGAAHWVAPKGAVRFFVEFLQVAD